MAGLDSIERIGIKVVDSLVGKAAQEGELFTRLAMKGVPRAIVGGNAPLKLDSVINWRGLATRINNGKQKQLLLRVNALKKEEILNRADAKLYLMRARDADYILANKVKYGKNFDKYLASAEKYGKGLGPKPNAENFNLDPRYSDTWAAKSPAFPKSIKMLFAAERAELKLQLMAQRKANYLSRVGKQSTLGFNPAAEEEAVVLGVEPYGEEFEVLANPVENDIPIEVVSTPKTPRVPRISNKAPKTSEFKLKDPPTQSSYVPTYEDDLMLRLLWEEQERMALQAYEDSMNNIYNADDGLTPYYFFGGLGLTGLGLYNYYKDNAKKYYNGGKLLKRR